MPIDQGQYMHAMEEDVFTGKPMPKNAVQVVGSDVQLPVDIQSRYATTIQTHNAVSVAAGAGSEGVWIDCNGFDKLALTMTSDAAVNTSCNLRWSNDGVTRHGTEAFIIPGNTAQEKSAITEIKARYVRVQIVNNDTAAHIMSAWAYLKA